MSLLCKTKSFLTYIIAFCASNLSSFLYHCATRVNSLFPISLQHKRRQLSMKANLGLYSSTLYCFFHDNFNTDFQMKLIEWFGGLKTNIAGSLLIILAYILFTISQALLLRAPTAMPILSVVAIGVFVFGYVAWLLINFSSFPCQWRFIA